MRYALIADVHANLPALESVLEAVSRERVDGVLCAGDLVGYGPFPNECVELLRRTTSACVAGNHDLIAVGRLSPDRCIALARCSLEWTRRTLSDDARAYLESLPLRTRVGAIAIAHGSLDDPQEYVRTERQARAQRLGDGVRVLVLGHTHRRALWTFGGSVVVNPGAVGQSREFRARARFAVVDGAHVSFRSVEYDVSRCRNALRERGLPESAHHLRPTVRRAGRAVRRRMFAAVAAAGRTHGGRETR